MELISTGCTTGCRRQRKLFKLVALPNQGQSDKQFVFHGMLISQGRSDKQSVVNGMLISRLA